MSILVQLDNNLVYLVDVGFGGSGLVRPVLLEDGQVVPGSASPEEHRIIHFTHPQAGLVQSEWGLQQRCGTHQPDWTLLYVFRVVETFPEDWVAYSQWLSAHPVPLFRENVIAVKFFLVDPDNDCPEAPIGRLAMAGRLGMAPNRVQRRVGDTSVTIKEFTTERERVKILKEDFGIFVDEDEISNIQAPAALPI